MKTRVMAILTAAVALALPGVAHADKASAWAKWEYRADGILNALHEGWRTGTESEGRRQRVKSICNGVTRDSSGGEGVVLPGWAMSLITACAYVDEVASMRMAEIWSTRDLKLNCKQMEKDAKALLKAKPIPEAPNAHEKALHLGSDLLFIYQGGCRQKKGLQSPYHPMGM